MTASRLLVYCSILASLLTAAAVGLWELRLAWRTLSSPRRRAFLAAGAILVLGSVLAARTVEVRGGYDNEHDFEYVSMDFARPGGLLSVGMLPKELSPLAASSAADLLSGSSLTGLIAAHHLLLLASALLAFGALRHAGADPWSSILGSGILPLSYLAVLSARSFSSTSANLFYFLSGLCALSALTFGRDSPGTLVRRWIWLLCAAFLTFTARFELFAVLVWGALLAAALGGRAPLESLRRIGPRTAALMAGAFLVFTASCAAWTVELARSGTASAPPIAELAELDAYFRKIHHHLGRMNLGALTGAHDEAVLVLLAALFALVWAWRGRYGPAARVLGLCLFLAGWLVCCSAVYHFTPGYPLHYARHSLYFLLPVIFLTGLAAHGAGRIEAFRRRPRAWPALVLCSLAAYGLLGARRVSSVSSELRTNDVEWRLLRKAQRHWPAGCTAVYPSAGDDFRAELIGRYFPARSRPCAFEPGECVLAYRSPFPAVLWRPEWGSKPDRPWESRAGSPVFEKAFEHRYYTVFPWEVKEPIPLRAGFYAVGSPEDCEALMGGPERRG